MKRRRFLQGAVVLMASGVFSAGSTAGSGGRGFYVPEEAGEHERTFMQWPVNRRVHRDPAFLGMLQQAVADVANAVVAFEPVVMLMDQKHERAARKMLGEAVEVWDIPTDDLWCRDSGPLFVVNEEKALAVSHIQFNGWGNKQVHKNDGLVAQRIAERLGVPLLKSGLVGEAGGIETDGDGTLVAHESCWVNRNRNSEAREQIELKLLKALGAEKMIWAPGVKGADITDYHIDALARFVEPGVVVIQLPEAMDKQDPWVKSAFETYDILKGATDAKGRKLKLVTLPEPYDMRVTAEDFVASYVNYYVCNGAVIVAQFGDKEADAEAKAVLARLYPGREVVTLDVDPIGEVGGGIHCATQQQPKV